MAALWWGRRFRLPTDFSPLLSKRSLRRHQTAIRLPHEFGLTRPRELFPYPVAAALGELMPKRCILTDLLNGSGEIFDRLRRISRRNLDPGCAGHLKAGASQVETD